MMRKIRGWKEDVGREKGRMKRMANVLIQASYRAAQTNKLELTLELEGAKARDDEATGIDEAERAGGGGGKGGGTE